MDLKYRIQDYLNCLTRQEHAIVMEKILAGIAPYKRATFYRWRKITRDESVEIPLSKQKLIAKVLKCSVEELTTPNTKKAVGKR